MCMTTIPERIKSRVLVDNTLKHTEEMPQSVKIHISIPDEVRGESLKVPSEWIESPKIELYRCSDEGPATKLLGALRNKNIPENAALLVIDDDIYYRFRRAFNTILENYKGLQRIYLYNSYGIPETSKCPPAPKY